jgi:ankyrin repeat protein
MSMIVTIFIACYCGFDQSEIQAKANRITIVKSLIDNGADFNYRKPLTLLTPLHWASYNNDLQVVNYLLSK